jgi:L-threonylcarbamoyladenylate synthase
VTLWGAAAALAAVHWPGALTLVLGDGDVRLPRAARGDGNSVAVRLTSHEGVRRLVAALGAPMTSTSANRAGLPPATSSAEIAERWPAETAAGHLVVLDGGVLLSAQPSTIVDCTGPRPRLLRAGAVRLAALRATVPDLAGEE